MGKGRMKRRYDFEPDYAVPPGETLQETIDTLQMTQRELAERTGLSAKTINLIIKGDEPISHKSALALERATGVPARMWNNLESNYREQLARLADRKRLEADVKWLDGIPTKELIKRGKIVPTRDKIALLDAVLCFFGVSSVAQWKQLWMKPKAVFRKSQRFEARPGAVATWLRLGELEAQEIQTQAYVKERFRKALIEIRALTTETPEVFQPRLVELAASAGVAVVFVPKLPKCPASGVTRWLSSDKALIQLSLRYKTEDQFWFSFFHEAGHVLNDPKKEVFIEDGQEQDERERRADRFAASHLIPEEHAVRLPCLNEESAILAFSREIGISPGIVLGRLQREGIVRWNSPLNTKLKRRFEWKTS